jgi:ribosomal protein S17E
MEYVKEEKKLRNVVATIITNGAINYSVDKVNNTVKGYVTVLTTFRYGDCVTAQERTELHSFFTGCYPLEAS